MKTWSGKKNIITYLESLRMSIVEKDLEENKKTEFIKNYKWQEMASKVLEVHGAHEHSIVNISILIWIFLYLKIIETSDTQCCSYWNKWYFSCRIFPKHDKNIKIFQLQAQNRFLHRRCYIRDLSCSKVITFLPRKWFIKRHSNAVIACRNALYMSHKLYNSFWIPKNEERIFPRLIVSKFSFWKLFGVNVAACELPRERQTHK